MTGGLEQRLRTVSGVSGLRIDLGREGLEGIHVSLDEGTDEAAVLDEIRRILMAYGLRSRPGALVCGDKPPTLPDSVWMGKVAGRSTARLTYGDHVFEGFGTLDWTGAVDACASAIAQALGKPIPQGVIADRLGIGDIDVVVVVCKDGGPPSAGIAVVTRGVAQALVFAITQALFTYQQLAAVHISDR